MQLLLRLFFMELKKNIINLPQVIIISLLLFSFIGVFAYSASNILFSSEELVQAQVGVITPDASDPMMKFALNYINHVESASLTLKFVILEEEEAQKQLKNGDILAILIFPENAINSVMYGNNVDIQIVFSKDNSLSSVFLTELTRSGASLLNSAQAGTYTTATLYTQLGASDALSSAYDDVDQFNFNYVLSRDSLFDDIDDTTLNGASSTIIYYLATALLLLLFFCGVAFAPSLRREDTDFYHLLFAKRVNSFFYLLTKWAAHVFTLFLFFLLCGGVLLWIQQLPKFEEVFEISQSFTNVCFLLLLAVFFASYHQFLYQIAPDSSIAILFFFVLGSLLVFLGGGIIPATFFPTSLESISTLLPSNRIHFALIQILSKQKYFSWFSILLYSIGFFILSVLTFVIRKERNEL